MDRVEPPVTGAVLTPPLEPMLARPATGIPRTARVAVEPKYDGYRALLFVDADGCFIQSRRGTPIRDCFPEIARAAVEQLPASTVVDGELVVWSERGGGCLDFAALQRRIVSPTRAAALAVEEPASYMAFDVLATAGRDLRGRPLWQRREALEELASAWSPPLHLTPQTTDPRVAERWLADYAAAAVGVEGVVIKVLTEPYKAGKRAWQKLRIRHTAEAVVGAVTGPVDAPVRLVLALPGHDGRLLVAGATTPLTPAQSHEMGQLLRPAAAGHPWPAELPAARLGAFVRESVPVTLVDPVLAVEVVVDTSWEFGRWRHPTRFLRARPDLPAEQVRPPTH